MIAMAERRLVHWVEDIPWWVDWLVAMVGGIVVLNLNVTSVGDPLSGIRGGGAARVPGISEAARTSFYVAITTAGAVLAAGALVVAALRPGIVAQALLALRAFGFLAAAGIAGLLFDYQDGPVRTVQLVVYVALILASIRFTRLSMLPVIGRDNESLLADPHGL